MSESGRGDPANPREPWSVTLATASWTDNPPADKSRWVSGKRAINCGWNKWMGFMTVKA